MKLFMGAFIEEALDPVEKEFKIAGMCGLYVPNKQWQKCPLVFYRTLRMNCPATIKLRASKCGKMLILREIAEMHTGHDLSTVSSFNLFSNCDHLYVLTCHKIIILSSSK